MMAESLLKAKIYSDWSKSNWQSVGAGIAPENSVKLAMNFDSDVVLGELISRKGSVRVGGQLVNNQPVLGLHNYRSSSLGEFPSASSSESASPSASVSPSSSSSHSPSSSLSPSTSVSSSASSSVSPSQSVSSSPSSSLSPSTSLSPSSSLSSSPSRSISSSASASPSPGSVIGDKLFAAVADGVNTDIYDVTTGLKSLEDDTKDLDTNFLTYLNSMLRLNGVDIPKAWNGYSWESTGGAFDLANLPSGSKGAIEFKDQVYVFGRPDSPDRLDKSSIANSTTRSVSWTTGTGLGFIILEQEDGGGGITALAKVPGYLIAFKKRTMKRYDGSSSFPEDLVNQGAPSQKAVVMSKGLVFWMNENDAWVSSGGDPKGIGSFMVREIIKSISPSDLLKVAAGTDEEHIFFSIPECTISGEVYTNVELKYNIFQNTWDIRRYPTRKTVYCKTLDVTERVYVTYGNDDGEVLVMDTGEDDNGIPINWTVEPQDLTFGLRMLEKGITRMGVITENVSAGLAQYRTTRKPEDWKPLGDGNIDKEVKDFRDIGLRGNYFSFKFSGTADSGQVKFLAIEFPKGIKVYETTSS